jgi:hypothetical protein
MERGLQSKQLMIVGVGAFLGYLSRVYKKMWKTLENERVFTSSPF